MATTVRWGALLLLVFAAVLPSVSQQTAGTVRYVNNTDLTCHSQSPCYSTIQAAVVAAQSKDTIRIQAGTYAEQLSIQDKNDDGSKTEADRIVIEAEAGPDTVILHSGVSHCTDGQAIRLQRSRFVTIRGLTITNAGGQAIQLQGGNNQNTAIHIERNRIFTNGSAACTGGITIAQGNAGTVISNNLIYNNGRNGIKFLDQDGGPHYVVGNTIYYNGWNGLEVARNHTVYLVNNLIVQNGQADGDTGGRSGVNRESATAPNPAGIQLLNNLICGNSGGQITTQVLDSTDSGNLTPTGSEGPGVSASSSCANLASVFEEHVGPDLTPGTWDDDFTLKTTSPAIDRGVDPRTFGFPIANSRLEADYGGEGRRPFDGNHDQLPGFDIGALESHNNRPPAADAGDPQTVHPVQLVQLDGTRSSDPDSDPIQRYEWAFVLPLPPNSAATLSDPYSPTPTFVADRLGEYIVQLQVFDGYEWSAPDTVTIATHNSRPVAHAGVNQTVHVGETVQLDASGSSDVDPGDLLTPTWVFVSTPEGSTATLSDIHAVRPTFVADKSGSYVVQLTVFDGLEYSEAPAMVTVSTENTAPLADAGPDQHVAVGQLVQLDGSGSADADGDSPLSYTWSFNARPAGSTAMLSDEQAVTPTFVADRPGTYVVQLIVCDPHGACGAPDTVLITTNNVRPVADAGPDQELDLGAVVQLDGSGSSDADTDSLTYSWSLTFVPEGSLATLSGETTATPAFTPDFAGVYVAQLIVNDGQLDSEPDTVTITVTSLDTTPPPPVDTSRISLSPITQGQVTITGTAGSVEGSARVMVTNSRTGQIVVAIANLDGGFTLQIAAQDGDILSAIVVDSAGNASAPVTMSVGSLNVLLTSPTAGATVQEGALLVRGTIEGGNAEIGVTVNDTPAMVQGADFLALVPVDTATTSLTAHAVSATGVSATTTVPLVVVPATGPTLDLSVSPPIGVAPLTVTFALLTGTVEVTQVTLDANGDGQSDFTGATLDDQTFAYTAPGLYEPTVTITDAQGQQFTVRGIVQVYDQTILDALLQAKWMALKDALRQSDITQALTQIHSQARARYAAIFQALTADLPDVDSILTSITLLEVRGGEAIYEMVRTDDTIVKSFELRFRLDADGIWRLVMF